MAVDLYRKYETTFILRPGMSPDDTEKVWGRVDAVFSDFKAHEIRREDWGLRKLAYSIDKEKKGVYQYVTYLGQGDMTAELERNFRLLQPVLKFLTVRLADDIDPAIFDFEAEKGQMTTLGKQARERTTREEEMGAAAAAAESASAEEAPAKEAPAKETKDD